MSGFVSYTSFSYVSKKTVNNKLLRKITRQKWCLNLKREQLRFHRKWSPNFCHFLLRSVLWQTTFVYFKIIDNNELMILIEHLWNETTVNMRDVHKCFFKSLNSFLIIPPSPSSTISWFFKKKREREIYQHLVFTKLKCW